MSLLRFDPLHTCIAFGPLAMYLVVLGMVNLSPRPTLTSGTRDLLALGLAIVGFVVVGPMELFLPEAAITLYGGWVWGMLVSSYLLMLVLIALTVRPRLVVYNITSEQLFPVLEEVLARHDKQFRWVGTTVVSQELGLQFYVEVYAPLKNVQLVASGGHQSLDGWHKLEVDLRQALRSAAGTPNPWGASLISFGVLIAGMITWLLADDPSGVQQALNDMLRR
jgi:hypothetical protein